MSQLNPSLPARPARSGAMRRGRKRVGEFAMRPSSVRLGTGHYRNRCYTAPRQPPGYFPTRHSTSGRDLCPSPCAVCCVFTRDRRKKDFLMSEAVRLQNKNCILAALPAEDYERLSPHLEAVELHHSQILYEAGGKMDYVYFPANSMVSLISTT